VILATVCLSFSGLVGNEIEKMASLGALALLAVIVKQLEERSKCGATVVPAVQGRTGLGRSLHPYK
jgi:hypothetical protein